MQAECRFSLSVMNDDYAAMIMNAIACVDVSRVQSHTDALSTTYRGGIGHTVDALRSCFIIINDRKTHITMEAAFTKGGSDGIQTVALSRQAIPDAAFDVLAKYAVYPLGTMETTPYIMYTEQLAKDSGIFTNQAPYGAELYGDEKSIFAFIQNALSYLDGELERYALHITLSVNSPSVNRRSK
ncbi:MAG: Ykof family thiamine-binding protein [Defluviitaleaceae bacterium]|nr:Ykof family thiamine-binding protein [Defluviitaleaceae bacterium]